MRWRKCCKAPLRLCVWFLDFSVSGSITWCEESFNLFEERWGCFCCGNAFLIKLTCYSFLELYLKHSKELLESCASMFEPHQGPVCKIWSTQAHFSFRFMVFLENEKVGYVDPRFRVVHLAVDHGDEMFRHIGPDFEEMVLAYLEMAGDSTLPARPQLCSIVNAHRGNEKWLGYSKISFSPVNTVDF